MNKLLNRGRLNGLASCLMALATAVLAIYSELALGGVTDVSPAPIFSSTGSTTEVKPNVMFVLDDSGSMDWDYMPDNAGNFGGAYGYHSSQCNGVYYNPAITYSPPVNSAGTSYANASFTAAWNDGYKTSSGTTNLSTSFQLQLDGSAVAAYYYVYSGSQTTAKLKDFYNTSSTFYRECNSNIGSTPGSGVFTLVTVSSTSGPGATDERTNFANWYSYYRKRILMMKTGSGQAFNGMDSHFRIGFMTINNNTSPAFLNISDFDSTQKSNWYTKLYGSSANNSTPLREALANAGRIYAGKLTSLNNTTVTNPVQYACQQNYTILSTDGFWNGNDSSVKKLDGSTTMDNQDGALPRPYNDGTVSTTTTVVPYTSTQTRQAVTSGTTTTNTWSKTTTVVGSSCNTASITTAPANLGTAPMAVDTSNHTAALGVQSSNPDSTSSHCLSLGNSAWFCRGGQNSTPAVSQSSVQDTSGKFWYLVTSGATASGCISANTAWGGNGNGGSYSTTAGVCPGVTQSNQAGKLVTVTPYTQIETISGGTSTSVDLYSATQTTTTVVTNGVSGATGPLTPSVPVYSLTNNVSSSSTPATSDTCGGHAPPCPSSSGTWTAGTPSPNNACIATALVPTAGTTTPTATVSTSGGSTVVTVLSSTPATAGTPSVTSATSGGTSDTLADVASYYYNTNLRTTALNNCTGPVISPATTGTNLCLANKVPPNGIDTATWQHMTTFTLGLGARGRMVFSPSYLNLTDTTSDYYYVAKGITASSTTCSWRDAGTVTGGPCNWPIPGADQIENVDDLWHAAVNGHGNYFSATDPSTLKTALSSSLNVIINTPKPGTAAAASTTNPRITSTNNFQFSSYFESVEWSGELIKQTINLTDGSVPAYNPVSPDPTTYVWSARNLLDAKAYTTRNIYTNTGTTTAGSLAVFNWSNLTNTLQADFKTPAITTSPPALPNQLTGLYQFCATGTDCIATSAQTNFTVASGGAAGEALVNFIRGDRTNEEGTSTDPSKFFRYRAHVLGDIVSSQPQYVGAPNKTYADTGYAAFVSAQANRAPAIYVGANDGMLHAFDSATGNENWAYIPGFALPRLYTLADKKYANKHQFFVEGTPKTADVYIGGNWKTILVGGMEAGGTGFYALDITNPSQPALLWEFTNANMGYSYGNPEITKLTDGRWVVLLTSGYNNCPRSADPGCVTTSGDGKGHLYVIDASNGSIIKDLSTGVGSSTSPSGLSKIVAQADITNTTKRVYGGDLMGNLWRFDIQTSGSTGFTVQQVANLKDPSGNAQPITVRPQVTTINGTSVVYVGTGRYLGVSDVGNSQQQTFYAIKDNVTTTPYTAIRSDSTFISKTAVNGTCPVGASVSICDPGTQVRTISLNTGTLATDNLATKNGWYVDFPSGSGEMDFTDPKLVLGTLAFSTSVPVASSSDVCGTVQSTDVPSFAYVLDYLSGGPVGNTTVIASTLGAGIATAPQPAQLPDGRVIAKYRISSGSEVDKLIPINASSSPLGTRRVSWRELIKE